MGNIGPNFNQPGQQMRQAQQPQGPASAEGMAGAPQGMGGAEVLMQAGAELLQMSLAPLFAFEQAMSVQQLMTLLKNLLKMPKEMVQLMALVAELPEAPAQELLQTLMTEDTHVTLEALQTFLVNNSDKAQDKLLKLLQSSHMDVSGARSEMGEVLKTLSDIVAKAQESPMQALHTTMALYLPWYPLQAPQQFSLYYETLDGAGGDGEGGGGEGDPQLVLLIDTLALGTFKINLSTDKRPTHLRITVTHDALAEPAIEEINQQVRAALSVENVPPPALTFVQRPGGQVASALAGPDRPTEKREKPAVGIHPMEGASVASLHAAYVLIRVILEIDNRQALTAQRKNKV